MPTNMRASKWQPILPAAGPAASRPEIQGYGIPTNNKGLLPWSHVSRRMAEARAYWIGTVSPDGRPPATPVDGIWLDERLFFGGSPTTRRHRSLAANGAAVVHLESASEVVILHGDTRMPPSLDMKLAARLAEASSLKYSYGQTTQDYAHGGVFEFWAACGLRLEQFSAGRQPLADSRRRVMRKPQCAYSKAPG